MSDGLHDEKAVLQLLQARNRAAAPACSVTRAYEALLADCKALEEQRAKAQKSADLQSKEQHEMMADLQLLRQNEANAGVSREHIELLQDQLEKSKSEAAQNLSAASTAIASEAATSEAARLMADKLAETQAKVADLEHTVKQLTAREQILQDENARLLARLTANLEVQAMAMDSEVEQHARQAQRREAREKVLTVTKAAEID
jgi:hypothetical protein